MESVVCGVGVVSPVGDVEIVDTGMVQRSF